MLAALQHIGALVGPWLYLVAGGLAFGEAAVMLGLVLPGETALLVAGFAAYQGWIGLVPMIAVAVGAAALGDTVGYEMGLHLGPRLRWSGLGRRVGEQRWIRAEQFLRRHGGTAVLAGRFTAVLRALTPGLAGMSRMPYLRTFLPYNLAGAILWGAGCVLLGYGFSASLITVGHYLALGPPAIIAVLVLVVLLIRRRRRRRTRRRDTADHEPPPPGPART